jgi:hypothetical protein
MNFIDFDFAANKARSDHVADLLRHAGVRFEQRVETETGRRPVYVIAVHADDNSLAEELRAEATRRENEAFIRTQRFVRQPYTNKDMLVAREPNEAGYLVSGVYQGEPFDETRFRLVREGWDHEHCYLCWAKVLPGDVWWATKPANYDNEIGLCVDCYTAMFGSVSDDSSG